MQKYGKSAEAVAKLTAEQYHVAQRSGTEQPGAGEYLDNKESGIYVDMVVTSTRVVYKGGNEPNAMRRIQVLNVERRQISHVRFSVAKYSPGSCVSINGNRCLPGRGCHSSS